MKSRLFTIALAMICLALLPGCEEFEDLMNETSNDPNSEIYEPRFIVGIFSIIDYPRASALEREIESGDGKKIWINTNQCFSSKHLRKARVVARPGDPDSCDLQFKFDRMGKVQWEMLSGQHRGEPVVLVVDGRYVAKFIPEPPDDDSKNMWITLRVGIDPYTAKGVAKFAEKNYYYYNPDAKHWWNF
ncbi:MAG: hypothetical protein MJ025_01825 [Victivallaceae bacterium]|nr:hypothetical protein [Victivallaceae bacterium]